MNMFFIFNIDIKYSGQRVHFCMNVRVKSYFGTPPHTKPEGHSFVSPRTLKVGRLQPFITIALQWDKQENLLARADFSLCFLVSQYVLTSKKYAAKHVCQQATEIMKYHFFFTWWSYNMAGRCQPPKPKLDVSHPRGWWEGWDVVCRVQPICVVFHSPQTPFVEVKIWGQWWLRWNLVSFCPELMWCYSRIGFEGSSWTSSLPRSPQEMAYLPEFLTLSPLEV